jgi:protein required for attachment to host cells
MKLANGTWVLVLDGEKYLLLRNRGDEELMDLRVIAHEEADNPPTREQAADRPGRLNDPGPGRSAVEETDWHALEKTRFALDMAERLRSWALDNRFDALVVVADPRTLGALRPAYHRTVAERIVAELDKDLTNLPVPELERALNAA